MGVSQKTWGVYGGELETWGVYGGELETALHLKNWSLLYSTEGLAITKATTSLGWVYNQKWR